MSEFRSRVVGPFLVPVVALIVGGIFVFALSRVLLAVPKYWSVSLAGLLAAEILGVAAVLAAVRKVTGAQKGLVGLLGVIVLAGGGIGFAEGIRPIETHGAGLAIAASGLAFDVSELVGPADEETTLEFDNQDANIPHNVSIVDAGTPLFTGEIFNGPASKVYELPAIPAGTYEFRCDVHPTMTGTYVAGGEGGEHGGSAEGGTPEPQETSSTDAGEHGGSTIVAAGSVFDLAELTVAAGAETHLTFQNDDAGIPHNVAIYADDTAGENLFRGETVTGPISTTYVFTIEEPGEYFFRCDVHPTMAGRLIAE